MEKRFKLRVGIIGAGVSGSATAYFLRESLGEHIEIVVYEKEAKVGGRIRSIPIGGEQLETGGSIIHSENKYLSTIVDRLGLQKKEHVYNDVGMWNGDSFTFRTGETKWKIPLKVLLRYGTSPVKIQPIVKDMIKKLSQIYVLLEQGEYFSDPEALFTKLGLYPLSQVESYHYFREKGISERYIQEFINGISRLNYGQDASIHGLVNLVSLAGASFGGHLFAIKGGNAQICEAMLHTSSAKVLKNIPVNLIHKKESSNHDTKYIVTSSDGINEEFDSIVIATPLEKAHIKFVNMEINEQNKLKRAYQVTNVTYVFGILNPAYFELAREEQIPTNILTRENPKIPFSSIELCKKDKKTGQCIYRIFSRQSLSDELLNRLFLKRVETKSMVWEAYPVLIPTSKWPSFVLERGVYYINAMESAVSTLETEVVGSRNVVNLLLKDYRERIEGGKQTFT